MALTMDKVATIPAGAHTGIITQCHETTKVFDPHKGPEPVVEIVIQPKWVLDGHRTLTVNVVFTPTLSTVSALGRFLARMGVTLEAGQQFVPQSLEGAEVAFTATRKADGFVVVTKDTLRRAA